MSIVLMEETDSDAFEVDTWQPKLSYRLPMARTQSGDDVDAIQPSLGATSPLDKLPAG